MSLVARWVAAVLAICAFIRAHAQEVSVICSEPLHWCEAQLFDWAERSAEARDFHTVAIYAAVVGFAYNRVALARKHLTAPRCWSDLARAEHVGGPR